MSGKVLRENGQPLMGGMVELRDVTNPEHSATALIGEDGEFSLGSIVGNDRVEGVIPGEYRATIMLDLTSQDQPPITLKKTYSIKEGDTELVLQMEK